MAENEPRDAIQFSCSISTDRDRYLRRTCPACGRDFKTQVSEKDLAWAVAPQIRRIGREIGAKSGEGETADGEEHLYCPYCDHHAAASEMLTRETLNYIRRQLMREMILPMFNNLFSGLGESGNQSGGLISIKITASPSFHPPRPIHGPEAPDMKIVEFLCCGKKAKVGEGWYGVRVCVFCGTPIMGDVACTLFPRLRLEKGARRTASSSPLSP